MRILTGLDIGINCWNGYKLWEWIQVVEMCTVYSNMYRLWKWVQVARLCTGGGNGCKSGSGYRWWEWVHVWVKVM